MTTSDLLPSRRAEADRVERMDLGRHGDIGVAAHRHVRMHGVKYERARRCTRSSSGARAVAYGARDYLEVYKAMLAMVRIAPPAVPPEQT